MKDPFTCQIQDQVRMMTRTVSFPPQILSLRCSQKNTGRTLQVKVKDKNVHDKLSQSFTVFLANSELCILSVKRL